MTTKITLTNRRFKTHPIVAHSPGPRSRRWARFEREVLALPPRRCVCPDLTILTFNNNGDRQQKPTGTLERSLHRLGIEPVVLGAGISPWQNVLKLRLAAEALQHVRTPYVMGADSCDVVVLDDPSILVDRFRRHFSCDLLFNTSGGSSWPHSRQILQFESSLPMAAVAQGRHWLNAGVWIGKTSFCREFFQAMAKIPPVRGAERSEQAVVKRAWPQWRPRVDLDYLCVLFQWFNESPSMLLVERSLAPRQRQLLEVLGPLGSKLRGAEVGVFDGSTSDALLRHFPEMELWMVDPWRPYKGTLKLGGLDQADFDRIRAAANTLTDHATARRFILQESSPQATRHFSPASLDFAFIDGNHLYDSVKADLAAWWPVIKPKGVLCGHDYGIHGDAQGLWGVRRAVDEFAAAQHRQVHVGKAGVWWIYKGQPGQQGQAAVAVANSAMP